MLKLFRTERRPDADDLARAERLKNTSAFPISAAYLCANDHVGNSSTSCPICASRVLLCLANSAVNISPEERYGTVVAVAACV